MAWVSGIPTVALFGSTRSDWTRPTTDNSRWVGSEDLACGACMMPDCRFGDVRCLERYAAEEILRLAKEVDVKP
jgi:ADP-heptose:LPS heptosyltransferase